jgi:uncharacterized protein YdeI (YjbR/CyaY-like superfamily)
MLLLYYREAMKKVSVKRLTLKRDINPMPKHIRELLIRQGLMERYKARPPYQQNDYLGWISRAKLETTKQKRIQQMVEELKLGDRYMNMRWSARR